LRDALAAGPIMIPGAFNALTARIAERLGYQAVYLSGGALSAGWAGLPDIGLLSLTEFVEQAEVLVRSTSLPLVSDADTGFGEAVNVARAVRLFERAGVGAIHLEDQVLPKRCGHLSGKSVVPAQEMAAKIRAATSSRSDHSFMIIARTDARSVEGFDAAVARARLYIEAGADMIFPEAMESAEEFARFASEIHHPLIANMTEFGKGPLIDFDELASMGYRAVLYPLTAFRAAMRAAEETLAELRRSGTQRGSVDRMLSRAELYDLIEYSSWEAADRSYLGGNQEKPKSPPNLLA